METTHETVAENTAAPTSETTLEPTARRRHYSLWELVRHKDYDRPEPEPDTDPTSRVLSSPRPSAWPDC